MNSKKYKDSKKIIMEDDDIKALVGSGILILPKDNRKEILLEIRENNKLINEIKMKNSILGNELGKQYRIYGRLR